MSSTGAKEFGGTPPTIDELRVELARQRAEAQATREQAHALAEGQRQVQSLYLLTDRLQRATSIDDIYTAAEAALGPNGLVEIVALCGFYTLISFLLNAFDVPLPAGEQGGGIMETGRGADPSVPPGLPSPTGEDNDGSHRED